MPESATSAPVASASVCLSRSVKGAARARRASAITASTVADQRGVGRLQPVSERPLAGAAPRDGLAGPEHLGGVVAEALAERLVAEEAAGDRDVVAPAPDRLAGVRRQAEGQHEGGEAGSADRGAWARHLRSTASGFAAEWLTGGFGGARPEWRG